MSSPFPLYSHSPIHTHTGTFFFFTPKCFLSNIYTQMNVPTQSSVSRLMIFRHTDCTSWGVGPPTFQFVDDLLQFLSYHSHP